MARWHNVLEIEGVTRHHALAILAKLKQNNDWHGFRVSYIVDEISDKGNILVEIYNPDGDFQAVENDPLVGRVILHQRSNIADVVSKPTLVRQVA